MLINNRDIHVETHGPRNGHPVVLLHHGLGSTRAWRCQIPTFAEAGFRLIIYDRWGYGKSELRPYLSVPSFKDDLADLNALLKAFNLDAVTLVGHSDGGSIALYYGATHPKDVVALVTVAAHIYLEPRMEPGIQGIKQAFDQDHRFRKGLQRAHGDKYESTFYNWFDGWHNPASLTWDMRPVLRNIRCPTLVIQGCKDEHASSQHAIDIADNLPEAELWLVPGVKHMLPQENAEAFNHKVISFLHSSLARVDSG